MKIKSPAPDGYNSWLEALKAEAPMLFKEISDDFGMVKAGVNCKRVIQKSLDNGEETFLGLTINGRPLQRSDFQASHRAPDIDKNEQALRLALGKLNVTEDQKEQIVDNFKLALDLENEIKGIVSMLNNMGDLTLNQQYSIIAGVRMTIGRYR